MAHGLYYSDFSIKKRLLSLYCVMKYVKLRFTCSNTGCFVNVFLFNVITIFSLLQISLIYFFVYKQQIVHLTSLESTFFKETIRSFKLRKSKEFSLQRAYANLSFAKKEIISHNYHRNITVQWIRRPLLPGQYTINNYTGSEYNNP